MQLFQFQKVIFWFKNVFVCFFTYDKHQQLVGESRCVYLPGQPTQSVSRGVFCFNFTSFCRLFCSYVCGRSLCFYFPAAGGLQLEPLRRQEVPVHGPLAGRPHPIQEGQRRPGVLQAAVALPHRHGGAKRRWGGGARSGVRGQGSLLLISWSLMRWRSAVSVRGAIWTDGCVHTACSSTGRPARTKCGRSFFCWRRGSVMCSL